MNNSSQENCMVNGLEIIKKNTKRGVRLKLLLQRESELKFSFLKCPVDKGYAQKDKLFYDLNSGSTFTAHL